MSSTDHVLIALALALDLSFSISSSSPVGRRAGDSGRTGERDIDTWWLRSLSGWWLSSL
jgi:hypothetical protein